LLQWLKELGQFLYWGSQVGIGEDDVLALRGQDPCPYGVAFALVFVADKAHGWVVVLEALHNFGRSVLASIVHYDYFPRVTLLPQVI
jgi:hypothetical protein